MIATRRIEKPRGITRSGKHGIRRIRRDNLIQQRLKITHGDGSRTLSGSSSDGGRPKLWDVLDFGIPSFWSWRMYGTIFKNMTIAMIIFAFSSGTISKNMTRLIAILTKLIARFWMRGAGGCKKCVQMRRFIQTKLSFFKNKFLNGCIQWWQWILI